MQQSSFIISMALFASGISTFIQDKKIGPIGSGLLSIQGTSFTFLGSVIAAVRLRRPWPQFLMIFSRFIPLLKKIITPLVSGIVLTLIGLSLIRVGIINIAGEIRRDCGPGEFLRAFLFQWVMSTKGGKTVEIPVV